MSSEVAIKVESLAKCYQIYDQPRDRLKQFILPRAQSILGMQPVKYYREFWAVKDVSFEVKKGETMGIIGRNGCGKSTLLQMICGTLNPTVGNITTEGRVAALLELGSGFNPEFSGRENVYMNASVLGLSKEEIDASYDEITAFADIGDFIERPVKTYSSGMMVRLAFSVAINVDPDILIVDEALAVGDAAFQRKCMRKLNELSESGMTLLFVSHSLETVKKICDSALYLRQGATVELGAAKQVCVSYERDLFGASMSTEALQEDDKAVKSDTSTALIDPQLLQTNEQTYGDGRALITDVVVANIYKTITNVLTPRTDWIVSYKATFSAEVACPVFGMMITNKEGVCIFGTNTDNHPVSKRHFFEADEVEIEFHLTNHLGPGIYYLTCGIYTSENNDGLIYLQRRMDVLIFKVIEDDGPLIGGVANLHPRIIVTDETG